MAKKTDSETEENVEKKAAAKKSSTKKAAPKKETKATTAKKTDVTKDAVKKDAKKEAPKKEAVKKVVEPKTEVKKESFKNDNISFDMEVEANCKVKYIASPSKLLWEKARKQAIKKIAKGVSIPGFRKGKAPESIILKKHSAQVKQETDQAVADLSFTECQKEAKTPILHGHGNITFNVEGEGEDKKLIFSFESEPIIPELDMSVFDIKTTKENKVDEKRVNEEIDNVRSFYADWEQIEDRGVEEGDFVLLDIDDLDQDPPAQVFNGARFEVKSGKMVKWMQDLVMGLKKGESVEGISKPDEKASEEDKKNFKEKKVKITIASIEKSTLPAIDDDLAKKVGVSDVAEMKEKLTNLVIKKDERVQRETDREEIEKQLIEKVLFDIPATLLEKEANHRMSQLFNNPEFKKDWEENLSEEEKDAKKEEIKEKSVQAIRLFYLCRNIVQENKISIGDDDLKPDYSSILEMMYADQKKLQYQSMSDEQKQMALTQVMMHKAEDYILDQLEHAAG
ncbi:MAG: Trigger factor [Chlamydiia bacterium]|nr:Trigger factor [Chlamydiia bacterium]